MKATFFSQENIWLSGENPFYPFVSINLSSVIKTDFCLPHVPLFYFPICFHGPYAFERNVKIYLSGVIFSLQKPLCQLAFGCVSLFTGVAHQRLAPV